MANVSLAVVVSYMLVVCVSCDDGHDKRILLSDPNYVQQQMTHLQGELQTLQAKVQTHASELQIQTSELQTQNAEVHTLQATVQTQTGEITSLKKQLSQANNDVQSLLSTSQTQSGEIGSLKQQLVLANQDRGGATFVRWGRTDCPANLTELVYSGYAGGSWWAHTGAAVDYVCLPRDPVWGPYKDMLNDDDSARMYGAEYNSPNTATPFGLNSLNEEVPCAVCRSTSSVSSVMIPARTTCYSDWTEAYSGSLAAGVYDNAAATQYVCVDGQAQPLDGGADTDDNGVLFFAVKAQCGSLRCPPYEHNKYLSCVVCMK